MFKHSATRTHETRTRAASGASTRAASGARAITAIFTVAAVILGLGVALTLTNNIWLFGLGLALIAGTLGVATSATAEVRAEVRATR
ncbi:MAG: hypothetical protein IPJ61_01575 [Tessaracoccus sp.]|uniref:hypothetical protein n=1 Tax=Tessaracoccus sp. TaxID=1971211 RepID=UPI001EB5735C|nr:hypothetical protein [Tessaracoccus sp.]MBK7819784.1 hypothetical protein [Tessaracoccus sp.]